jgi:hypothetical protein
MLLQMYAMPVEVQASSEPAFATVSTNPFELEVIDFFSTPSFADLDGDGDMDLIRGASSGDFFYFENTGSSSEPAFATASTNPFELGDIGYRSAPVFVDLDGDGDMDLISGENGGNFFYFENTGSASAPAFAPASTNPFGLDDTGYGGSAPSFADLDGDGDMDLLNGRGYGDFVYFENTGSSSSPVFAEASTNPFGLSRTGYSYSTPAFADLDGDGDMDLISGDQYGNFFYFENTGSSSSPAFAVVEANPFGLSGTGYAYSAPALADLDGDGDMDLLSGGREGNFFYFENRPLAPLAFTFAEASTNPFGLSGTGYYRSTPSFSDLDGDGDMDLISGDQYGNFFYFENTGSSSSPAFAEASTNPFGLSRTGYSYDSTPSFSDLDGDGDMDLLSGGSTGDFVYFENTGSSSSPAFAAASTNPFGLGGEDINSAPAFSDLDGDGDMDLLSGVRGGKRTPLGSPGNFFYFANTGSPSSPAFAEAISDPFGLGIIGSWSTPAFADLDGDGDMDLLSGASPGDFFYFENTGSASAPAFAEARTNPSGLGDIGYFSAPSFSDLDGDGDMDLISGETYGNFVYFENITEPASTPALLSLSTAFGAPGDTLRIGAHLTTIEPVAGLQFITLLGDPTAAHVAGL